MPPAPTPLVLDHRQWEASPDRPPTLARVDWLTRATIACGVAHLGPDGRTVLRAEAVPAAVREAVAFAAHPPAASARSGHVFRGGFPGLRDVRTRALLADGVERMTEVLTTAGALVAAGRAPDDAELQEALDLAHRRGTYTLALVRGDYGRVAFYATPLPLASRAAQRHLPPEAFWLTVAACARSRAWAQEAGLLATLLEDAAATRLGTCPWALVTQLLGHPDAQVRLLVQTRILPTLAAPPAPHRRSARTR